MIGNTYLELTGTLLPANQSLARRDFQYFNGEK